MKICSLRAEFYGGGKKDGWTELMKQIIAFRNFAKGPKIYLKFVVN